jgi:hypothetical protein
MYEVANMTLTRQHIDAISSLAHRREYIHNIYKLPSLEPTICYLHATAGFPPKSTWLKAVRQGNYSTWPLINVKNVAKYFPESEETQMGHMQGQRQGVCSTRPVDAPGTINNVNPPNITVLVSDPTPTAHIVAHDTLIRVIDLNDAMYMDQTGHFPFISSLGNRYFMILHHVDSNSSWSKALKNNSKGKLILTRCRALVQMAQCGIVPRHQILDNQALFAYKTQIKLTKMTYELVPPDDHQRNLAKKVIQTFKDHMISVLSGCLPTIPMHLWCQLLPQIEHQLLLLHQSKSNPNILAYAHVYGHHNCNRHPFVPIGMEALVNDRPHKRRLFAQHCRKAFILGTSAEHYQCWKFWLVTTCTTRILGAAFFKHKYLTNPVVTPEDRVIEAAGALAQALNNQMPSHMHKSTIQALSNLQDVFQQAAINHNVDPATHVTPAAPPRVPPDTLPEPATPATSPRVHAIPNTPVVPT